MIKSNVIGNFNDNVPSDHSTITDNTANSRHTDEQLTTEQKKRKFDQVYLSRR